MDTTAATTIPRPSAPDRSPTTSRGHRGLAGQCGERVTYTVELTGAARLGPDRYDALHHLEGNFPGGVADLHFRFTLRDGLISRLVIEP